MYPICTDIQYLGRPSVYLIDLGYLGFVSIDRSWPHKTKNGVLAMKPLTDY